MHNKKRYLLGLSIVLWIGLISQESAAQVYISDYSDFPAYPYNTTAYRQGGRYVGCGPTTGAMMFGYFDHSNQLAPNGLLTNPGSGVNEGLNTAWALHAAQYMNTGANGFGSVYNIEPAMEDYGASRGYNIEVMIHVGPTYNDPNAAEADWLNDYGPYGTSWNNDGTFWHYSAGSWSIDPDDFCDFVAPLLSAGIPIFLTIDTDEDRSGDHWVPLVGYNKTTGRYAYYDTYSTTLQWADIHYCNAPGPTVDNAISFIRSVAYEGAIGGQDLNAPTDLIALTGYDGVIPLAWNAPSDTRPKRLTFMESVTTERMRTKEEALAMRKTSARSLGGSLISSMSDDASGYLQPEGAHTASGAMVLLGYNVYRSTSQSGSYTEIASDITRQYYRDETVTDGQTYYYKVTAVHSTGESDFSNTVYAQSESNGYTIFSGWTTAPPVYDGVINAGEWSDAATTNITYPGASGMVTLYTMNDGNRLYFAVDDQRDTQKDHLDQFALFFDENLDREWPSEYSLAEGNYWFAWDAGGFVPWNWYGPRWGYWPDNLQWPAQFSPPGAMQYISTTSGHMQYEASISLTTGPLLASPGDVIGILMFVYDHGPDDFTSFWPQAAERLKTITPDIQLWGQAPFSYGDVVLSTGVSNAPAAPSNLNGVLLGNQIHLTWQDNSDDELGFLLEVKDTPGVWPVVWQDLANLTPNTTSYQMDNPSHNHTYYFRIAAYNNDGTSNYSQEVSVYVGYQIGLITITAPNGGEVWNVGSTQNITWDPGSYQPPSHVTITYSTDGGSNWVSPAIASSTANSGSFQWTVPNTPSTNCIVKVKNANNDFPYDLSNHPFTIAAAGPQPVLGVDPMTLNFGTTLTSLTFDITNTGGGTLTWNITETPDVPWLTSFSPSSGTNDATVTVTVDRSQLVGSSGTTYLEVTSNGGDQDLTVNISRETAQMPSHWTFTGNTGNSAVIVLPTSANPNLDGTPLSSGDYVGVFTPADLCCGYSQWQGQNLSITAWGDDSQTTATDGFQAGETIAYRLFRPSTGEEWTNVTVEYSQGSGSYSSNGFMVLSRFDVSDMQTATINFGSGWNMFSINVNPADPNVGVVMTPVADELVIMKNNGGQTYIPDYGINNIGSIDYKQGYQAYFDQAATLTVEGALVDPTTPISLTAGWSMIAYLPGSAMNAATALASIATQLVLAKDNAGQTYIPDYGINNIGQMQPGQGYQVYLDGAGTLTYPAGVPAKRNENIRKLLVQHFQFTSNTGDNATIVVPEAANPRYSDGSPLGMGDEIGVFTSAGLCCGAVVWNGENIAITVWGDNSQTPETDGFMAGDAYHFRVWKMSTDTEYIAAAAFQPGHPGVYGTNNYSVITELVTDLNTSGGFAEALRPSDYRLFANHPNPFNPSTKIRFALPKSGHVIVKIFDLRGKEIQTLVNGRMPEGEHTVQWDARYLPSGIYFCRMEADGFVDTRKLVLQK